MSVPASTLRKLASLSLSAEQMAGVLDILADGIEAEEARKAAQRERTAKSRAKQKPSVTLHSRYGNCDDTHGRVARVEDKPLTQKIEPQETNKREREPSAFERWYAVYPHKVQRGAAERAFPKALSIASLDDLIDGVHRYIASKPADRQWQNPATWLNGKGWLDAPAATVVPMARAGPRRNALMDRLNEMTGTPPNDLDTQPPQAPVFDLTAIAYR